MYPLKPFPHYPPLPSDDLPLTLISLEDWSLITIEGKDTVKYLQGQLTCDVLSISKKQFTITTHCNAKGKVLSCLYIFYYQQGLALIVRRSVQDKQINELKKYAIFSKVEISINNNIVLLGLAGLQAHIKLCEIFGNIPNDNCSIIHYQETTLLYFSLPSPRFLLITTPRMSDYIKNNLKEKVQINDSQQWLALDIESGYPIIDYANFAQFIPQAINMHALNGISFNKGCYIGQEIIARTKYRGTNKRALYWLAGKYENITNTSNNLELKIRENWRKTGTILASCKLANQKIWVQAVLNLSIKSNDVLRLYNNVETLSIQKLPYKIN